MCCSTTRIELTAVPGTDDTALTPQHTSYHITALPRSSTPLHSTQLTEVTHSPCLPLSRSTISHARHTVPNSHFPRGLTPEGRLWLIFSICCSCRHLASYPFSDPQVFKPSPLFTSWGCKYSTIFIIPVPIPPATPPGHDRGTA